MAHWIMVRDIRVKIATDEQLAATCRLLNLTCIENDNGWEDDGIYPPPCPANGGAHSWVISEEDDRCYCEFCLADGDA